MFELLLGTTVVNSWIIYNMVSSIKPGITEFRRQLAEQLVTKEVTIVQDLGPIPRKRLHAFIKPEGPGRKPRRSCQGCYQDLRKTMGSRDADRKVRRIAIFCNDCPDKPAFCLACFNKNQC
ncbi:hypothetical protein QE152_g8718 [Popillia japonica]|uniref:PiggyBac transposable element-derived protein 4 C-terminal zinc-ribbon domain-containing protein n=1 Tax=Popillia japonica TaxID=7064 RepID=A0AAW1M181_POPJA